MAVSLRSSIAKRSSHLNAALCHLSAVLVDFCYVIINNYFNIISWLKLSRCGLKYDKAYSDLFDECLTIYEVRELNFDEESDYNSEQDRFYCPDSDCRLDQGTKSVLTTVNANKIKYKKTPHFKDTPSTVHRESCPYSDDENSIVYVDPKTSKKEGTKATDYPTEFLLERKKYTKKKKPKVEGTPVESEINEKTKSTNKTSSQGNKTSPNTTSVFEHIVECFLSNQHDKEMLKAMPLTISGVTANYNYFFKKIRYFQDGQGLIYWGRVKEIKDYKYSFGIVFEDRVSNTSIKAYINKATIQSYRKKQYFTNKIRSLISDGDDVNCFFLGSYPELQNVKNGEHEFNVYNVKIVNLDHFLLRVVE
ncbi:conserved hypothetical protein [Vibrio chagasii]|nr:conserved hypothetical protein [Vibrio chagasii]CAH7337739.1 conserved hypothetical protein [Vibrio chagasii]CAH7395976.1 conserved hypothetical protein [Vibrio chagasii]CAH7445816.1 conserved hypothetical protein [Vibrio chagasii]